LSYTFRDMKRICLTVVALCLPLLACYEEPVRDHLHISFAPGPAIVVTAVRDIASPGSAGENPAVADRLDEARSDLAGGWDRWSRSFAELGALAERSTIERHDGRARRGIHSALVDSFRPVERLLGNEGLGAYYNETDGIRDLQLHPAGAGQATRQQRAQLDEALVAWSEEVSSYLEAATALYVYLDRTPERAVLCFGYIFDEDEESLGPLNTGEGELVAAVIETMERVADVLLIDSNQAYSLNELSRLVFDTFQGRLTVTLDGPIIKREGFIEGEGYVERPPVSLWRSLETMVGQWLVPDLVTAMVTPGPEANQPEPDPVAFAAMPRSWAPPPEPLTVESVLRSRLRPESVYLVRWQTRPAPDDENEVYELALQQLATAEQNLPE
jgi:hypothetical protein